MTRRRALFAAVAAGVAILLVIFGLAIDEDDGPRLPRLVYAETVLYDAATSEALSQHEAVFIEGGGDAVTRTFDRSRSVLSEAAAVGSVVVVRVRSGPWQVARRIEFKPVLRAIEAAFDGPGADSEWRQVETPTPTGRSIPFDEVAIATVEERHLRARLLRAYRALRIAGGAAPTRIVAGTRLQWTRWRRGGDVVADEFAAWLSSAPSTPMRGVVITTTYVTLPDDTAYDVLGAAAALGWDDVAVAADAASRTTLPPERRVPVSEVAASTTGAEARRAGRAPPLLDYWLVSNVATMSPGLGAVGRGAAGRLLPAIGGLTIAFGLAGVVHYWQEFGNAVNTKIDEARRALEEWLFPRAKPRPRDPRTVPRNPPRAHPRNPPKLGPPRRRPPRIPRNCLGKEAADELLNQLLENEHHILTNKNPYWANKFAEITDGYGLDLNGDWNKVRIKHRGPHPIEYHEWVYERLKLIHRQARGNVATFKRLFRKHLWVPIKLRPLIVLKQYWECRR